MNRRNSSSVVANPVLVGAVTTLVVIVAVFLAYNANNGLPFVPTTEVKVQIPSGANLVKGNEVREGGYRVGVVSDIAPVAITGQPVNTNPEGGVDRATVGAQLTLKLDQNAGKLPVDSTVSIRPRSALGLKYVELTRGRSQKRLSDGGTIPVSQTTVPVQFDDVYRIFDTPTRVASRANLEAFGNAFAGRGADLNTAIASLPQLFGHLAPVAGNLADPQTRLSNFFVALNRFAGAIAPVAGVNARLFSDMATTFEAFSRDPGALKSTIEKSPSTLDVSTDSLRAQRPFLTDTALFASDLKLATHELRGALPDINPALEIGAPVLRRSVSLNGKLQDTMRALGDLASAPSTNLALRGLTATVTTLNPTLRYVGPYVTVCNFWNYFWTFAAEQFSEQDPTGESQRALLQFGNQQHNGIGAEGAARPANGFSPTDPSAIPIQQPPEYAHGQAYGAAVNSNGTADCEADQRGYPTRLTTAEDPKLLVATDAHTPGSQGPDFKSFDDQNKDPKDRALGTDHVPAGETFTRDPGGIADPLPASSVP